MIKKQTNKLAIAEFVFAKNSDTLIISEVRDCVNALKDESIINDVEYAELNVLLSTKDGKSLTLIDGFLNRIPEADGLSLMKEYYSGKL